MVNLLITASVLASISFLIVIWLFQNASRIEGFDERERALLRSIRAAAKGRSRGGRPVGGGEAGVQPEQNVEPASEKRTPRLPVHFAANVPATAGFFGQSRRLSLRNPIPR